MSNSCVCCIPLFPPRVHTHYKLVLRMHTYTAAIFPSQIQKGPCTHVPHKSPFPILQHAPVTHRPVPSLQTYSHIHHPSPSHSTEILTCVAVMKKFHGSNVPRPSMKKISQTPLYLWVTERWGQSPHVPSRGSWGRAGRTMVVTPPSKLPHGQSQRNRKQAPNCE